MNNGKSSWIVSWACAQQLVEPDNNPPEPHLEGNTLRQMLHASAGGKIIRIKLSNMYSSAPASVKEVHIAGSLGNGKIDTATDKQLLFEGSPACVIPRGKEIWSDPLDFDFPVMADLAVSICFGKISSKSVTGHPGSRTVSYIKKGNAVSDRNMASAAETEHWYVLAALETAAPEGWGTLVTVGDSITDGRGSTTNQNNRWPDNLYRHLCKELKTPKLGLYNAGIGGNAVIKGGLGPVLLNRFSHDVLEQSSVRWVIIFEGVNDIGPFAGKSGSGAMKKAEALIKALSGLAKKARAKGIKAYGATITPFGDSFYHSSETEKARQYVNKWIREQAPYDAVIDMDMAVRSQNRPEVLKADTDSGDHLHLSPEGFRLLAKCIDPGLFE